MQVHLPPASLSPERTLNIARLHYERGLKTRPLQGHLGEVRELPCITRLAQREQALKRLFFPRPSALTQAAPGPSATPFAYLVSQGSVSPAPASVCFSINTHQFSRSSLSTPSKLQCPTISTAPSAPTQQEWLGSSQFCSLLI